MPTTAGERQEQEQREVKIMIPRLVTSIPDSTDLLFLRFFYEKSHRYPDNPAGDTCSGSKTRNFAGLSRGISLDNLNNRKGLGAASSVRVIGKGLGEGADVDAQT